MKIGDKVPDFKAVTHKGEEIQLSGYLGKKLIIFFYPKASTPGCTAQACNLNNGYSLLKQKGYEIIGISADSIKKQANFATKNNFIFPLIADENRTIINLFGIWGEKKFMGKTFDGILRTTFVLDENQYITHIIDKVKTKNHTEQLLEIIS